MNENEFLNLGCGSRFINNWTNIDFASNSPFVKKYNLTKGIPYDNETFKVVYHSHVLEHFSKDMANYFLSECFRVLEKNGILRIAVPDLEQICRLYIEQLNNVRSNPSSMNQSNYDWITLELYDQPVRNVSGGEMAKYWSQVNILNEKWLINRVGQEYIQYRKNLDNSKLSGNKTRLSPKFYLKAFLNFLYHKIYWIKILKIGKFRTSGEIHQWMYDSHSLGLLLSKVGFTKVKIVDAFTSDIENWNRYNWLDVENNVPRKPDSLYIEAIK